MSKDLIIALLSLVAIGSLAAVFVLWNTDTADVEYSKATMDAALKQIYGDKFQPWEVRYGRS